MARTRSFRLDTKLAQLLSDGNISMTELAEKAKISYQTVFRYVHGEPGCTAAGYKQIASALGVHVDEIAENINDMRTPSFPDDLLREIMANDPDLETILASPMAAAAVDLAIATLDEREKTIIEARAKDGITLQSLGDLYGVTRECIRQVEARAKKKLATGERARLIKRNIPEIREEIARRECLMDLEEVRVEAFKLGYEAGRNEDAEDGGQQMAFDLTPRSAGDELEKAVKKNKEAHTKIESLNLSVRSVNGLRKAGIETLGQLKEMAPVEILRLRNIGKRSYNEICDKLSDYGVEYPKLV